MKRNKIVFTILLSFFLLGIAGILYLKSYFTQERIKALLLPALEKKIHGTILIDTFDFSLIRGVTLKSIKVQIEGKKGVSSFQCEQVFLRPRLFPLIFAQLVIGEIRLIRPQIFILEGLESLAVFPSGLRGGEPKGERKEKKTGEGEKEKLGLAIEGVKIEKGDIIFINPGGSRFLPPVLQLEGIDLSVIKPSLDSSIPFSFSGMLKGIESDPLRIKGLIRPREKAGDLSIAWEKLQVKSLNQALHVSRPFLAQGKVDMEFHLNVKEASPLLSEGRIKITDAQLARSEPEEAKKRDQDNDINAEATYHITISPGKGVQGNIEKGRFAYRDLEIREVESTFSWHEKTLGLTQVKGSVGKGLLQGKGNIAFDKESRHFSVEIKGDRIPIDKLVLLSGSNQKKDITGTCSGECQLTGIWEKKELKKEDLQGRGEIRLYEGKISGIKALEQASTIIGYKELNPLMVTEGKMHFLIEEGKIKTEGWTKSPDLEVSYKGNARLDSTLNIRMEVMCSSRVFAKFKGAGVTDLLKDEQGRIIVPLKLKGTWDNPSVRLDNPEFKKMMKDKFLQFYEGFREGM